MYSAAAGFSTGLTVEPSKLLASGPTGASLIHWGSLIDMFGYLSIAPVVVYLRDRYASARYVDLFAAAGLAVVVIGSIGAVSMATAAPALINDYVAGRGPEAGALAGVRDAVPGGCPWNVADAGGYPSRGLASGYRFRREARGAAICFCDPPSPRSR